MIHRLGPAVLALVALTTPALVASQPAAAAGRDVRVSAPGRFSPDGDGVKDDLRITVRLAQASRVRLEIGPAGARTIDRRVDLGRLSKGTHTWTWNGRNQSGTMVADRAYRITARTDDGATAVDRVQVDTSFAPRLAARTYGAAPGTPARVYPRTRVVRDAVDLDAWTTETKVDSLELVIRDRRGRVVRRDDVDRRIAPGSPVAAYSDGRGRRVPWFALRAGRPLPSGRYTAVVTGRDLAGNRGHSKPLPIWVSRERLEWREVSTTVSPQASAINPCTWQSANGCADHPPCGEVVASATQPGGLSYRSAPCTPADPLRAQAAVGTHALEVPAATGVRGLDAVRVAFTGAATTAGEPDVGRLTVLSRAGDGVVDATSGQSPWVERPLWGEGIVGDDVVAHHAPAAVWSYTTTGTDSVDIASFTVDVRYLAVAD
ncbi:hypothetical protein KDN32_00270 [Nocardioides sp. J2M5]|uniref:FlgD immunoglobulin-like domain containing protein n=1 Tax=Nocardioides palaemonis TaxID=2829810 RepID=UPI001BAD9193|nr:FlgD immunoglobulin-like domain containing protein [Nocardioides palaemonis]MBS2936173.1 hypothetical protein [Nocardioides palaemonis]